MHREPYLAVTESFAIPRRELELRASRAGGPGGQHVNRTSTRIELLWDLAGSHAITHDTRERLRSRLANRLDAQGRVRVVSSARRSQLQNRLAAESKLIEVIRAALHVAKPRRATRPNRAAVERRLEQKRRQGTRKRQRGWQDD